MDSARSMISSAMTLRTAGDGGGQVFLFGGGGLLRGAPLVGGAGAEADGRRKRPFQLTSHEELGDDELMCGLVDYELNNGGSQQQGERTTKRRLTAEQVRELELSFEEEKRKLEPERKSELARRLGIAPRQVAVWFQNRRARWRTKQLEHDFDRLRAAHDHLLAGRDALLADNDRLRAQVITLTEKLQAKESSASQAEEQTVAVQAAAYTLFGEDNLCSEVVTSSAAAPAAGTNGSPESYLAGARSPPSSPEDDDCGYGADDDRTFSLPDARLPMGVEQQSLQRAAEEDEDGAHLNSWAWLWNDQQY